MNDASNLSIFEHAEVIEKKFAARIAVLSAAPEGRAVEDLRIAYLGRKGELSSLMEGLKKLSKDERPRAGKVVNELRGKIESELETLKIKVRDWQIEQKLAAKALDVSLPVDSMGQGGSLHPVSLIRSVLIKEFRHLGFSVCDGPEVDLDFYNFSALNFREDHPARDMQDTFFIQGQKGMILRTHTSNIQIHTMLKEKPPLRVVALGRTFRCDSDMTHTPMFHQVEGFIVDNNISMAHMKGVIDHFLRAIFGANLATRLRPSYFPFVEPGAEVDLECIVCHGKGCRTCKHSGWLEVGGLGMIHPNVFEAVDYDSERFTGFAFGFGIDRLAMLKYGLPDLRQLFEGDQEFLGQFPVYV